jgi:hypothetical protein
MHPQKVTGSEVKITLLKSEKELESTCSLLAEPKRKIGVLTSGGDSSGMNAAVRAITRYALQKGCQPYAIFEGYNGLVEGGDKIKSLGWEDVRGLLSMVIIRLLPILFDVIGWNCYRYCSFGFFQNTRRPNDRRQEHDQERYRRPHCHWR